MFLSSIPASTGPEFGVLVPMNPLYNVAQVNADPVTGLPADLTNRPDGLGAVPPWVDLVLAVANLF